MMRNRRLRGADAAADALVEGYVAWRETSADVRAAYERWRTCTACDRHLDFEGYLAALEREEHAARVYERLVVVWPKVGEA
jgi:hypothetical protein